MLHQREIPAAQGSCDQIQAQSVLRIAVGILLILHGKVGIRKRTVINDSVTFLCDHFSQSGASTLIGKRGVPQRDDGGDSVVLMSFQKAGIHGLDIILRFRIELGGIRVRIITGILADIPDDQPYDSAQEHQQNHRQNRQMNIIRASHAPPLSAAGGRT